MPEVHQFSESQFQEFLASGLTADEYRKLCVEPQDLRWLCKKPDAQWYYDQGEWRSACRYDECSSRFKVYDTKTGRIKRNVSACKEVCYCENCAHQRFQEIFNRYRTLARVIPESFTYITTTPAAAPKIKKLLKKRGPLLGLFTWRPARNLIGGRFETRLLLCAGVASIPTKIINKLREADPDIHIDAHFGTEFLEVLNQMLMPTLPKELSNRLIMKRVKRRLTFEGASRELRIKLFGKRITPLSNNLASGEYKKPVCEVRGCLRHTETFILGTPEEQWTWIVHEIAPEGCSPG